MSTKSRPGGSAAFGGSPVPTVAGVEGNDVTASINVTPMIDVMLVLLIIFMVITPLLMSHSVQLPSAVTAAPEKDDRVTLTIDPQGGFYLEQRPEEIPATQLAAELRELYTDRPLDHVLYLKADQAVEYSVVLTAINAARTAGVRRIGAITEAPKNNNE